MFKRRIQRLAGGLLALAVVWGLSFHAYAATSQDVFANLAKELLEGLKSAPTGRAKVAIRPYQAEDVPIPSEDTSSLSDHFIVALHSIICEPQLLSNLGQENGY